MNGIYFYKLQSEYPNDVTKNCKLTINEIDSNFKFLEDMDISACTFNRDTKQLILTRNNGETLVADLSDVTYNLDVTYDDGCGTESGATLTISYDGKNGKETIVVDKLVTTDNLKSVIGSDILTKVITDDTLTGNGTIDSPLSINKSYETGMYGPVLEVIDTTTGGTLPEDAAYGAKYLTKEIVDDYGYLYTFDAVQKIQKEFEEKAVSGKEEYSWHVPSKAEWDSFLNSQEDCLHRNHDSESCHTWLGNVAGRKLKSICGWNGEADCACGGKIPSGVSAYCSTGTEEEDYVDDSDVPTTPTVKTESYVGTDEIGFTSYPTGYAQKDTYGTIQRTDGKEATYYWTNTLTCGDVYTKGFIWNHADVYQAAYCPTNFASLRLVKKYDGSNYFGSEIIDGKTYDTILVPETGQIWLASNYAGISGLTKDDDYTEVSASGKTGQRSVFYINTWNGSSWSRKELSDGDTVVINYCGEEYNNEYRVYYDENCNAMLINTDDLVVERVLEKISTIIEEEKKERKEADAYISGIVDSNTEAISSLTINFNNFSSYTVSSITKVEDEISEISGVTSGLADTIKEIQEDIEDLTQSAITISGDVINEIARAKSEEQRIEGEIPSGGTYTLYAETSGLIIPSKDGSSNNIIINFDGDFGILK